MNRLSLSYWLARLRHATFRRQLIIAVAIGVFSVGSVTALLSTWQGSLQVRETLVQQGLSLANSVAQQSQLALLTESADNAREPIERAMSFTDILQVELLYTDGRSLITRGTVAEMRAGKPQTGMSGSYLETETSEAWRFVAPVYTKPAAASPFEANIATPELLGYVRVTQGKAALSKLVSRLAVINFGVGLVLSCILLGLLRLLAHRLSQPLGALSTVMAQAGKGQMGLRAVPDGPSDIASMAQVFNSMMQSLEQREQELQETNAELANHAATLEEKVAQRTASLSSSNAELQQALRTLREAKRQLIESDKLASLGRLVAGVAHELNTPLGNALMAASTTEDILQKIVDAMASGGLRKSEFERVIAQSIEGSAMVTQNVQRAAEIIRGFKQLAVDQTTEMRRVFEVDNVISEILFASQPMFKHKPYQIETKLTPGLKIDSYPGPLGQVISNLIQNALVHGFAGRDHGCLTIESRSHHPDYVQIICSDDGVGMSEAVRLRIFEAFFTTKFGQGGSGLGMQIVYNLVTGLLGGEINVESVLDKGTRITITLPCAAPQNIAS
ncbi:sensor histidine kinase [Undibacterium flavidum]|uniref:histidine kinase n=1 Tax=Undibacterium flavidum TaxID=2762297 RepID=A0ABR6YFZ7_9BURK|nr:ATP-binding protein [Undibacterium flavidum]MBC3875433.1 HAMP domain-containing protein [Undibacterium flavidum]